jgi:flagellar hook-associated protein 1 FlgK
MSLSVALKTATSGLLAAQAGLRTVSDNIANVNTPGYVRKTVDQQPLVVDGKGMGVEVTGVKRITDQYLQLASLTASSDASRWDVVSNFLDNAQSLFGDPSGDSFFFTRLDDVWSAFAAAADDPSSSLLRSQALANVEDFLSEASRINAQLGELGRTVDGQVLAAVSRSNDLLEQINRLNTDITRAKLAGGDASGSENIQSQLVDELSTLMNLKVTQRAQGGIIVRSAEGVMLAGEGAATLSYNRTDSTRGYITAVPASGGNGQPIQITGGEIRGLLDLRDDKLAGMSGQLGEFMTRVTEQINAAHNASASAPAPTTLTGRDTGLDLPTAISGFTGTSTVAVVNATGVVQRRVAIDFTAGTMSVDGGGPTAFTPATFLATLNGALGAFGSASVSGGALSLSATGANGLAIDEGTSQHAGKAFSHFFGLNDLIRSTGITTYDTGLAATDPHGFTPGGQITFRLAESDGKPITDVVVTVPAAPNMSDLIAALNSSATGVGLAGQFTLSANGGLAFTGTPPRNATLSVLTDTTARGVGGPSISGLFGIGVVERTGRAGRFSVDQRLISNPMQMSLGKLDLSVPATQPALRAGDGRGALALAGAGDVVASFSAAGTLGQVNMTVARYAAEFGGSIGREANAAETRKSSSEAVKAEAEARRQSIEGVNIDEELVRLTTYQQAFSASARLIQAAQDMFDVLAELV